MPRNVVSDSRSLPKFDYFLLHLVQWWCKKWLIPGGKITSVVARKLFLGRHDPTSPAQSEQIVRGRLG